MKTTFNFLAVVAAAIMAASCTAIGAIGDLVEGADGFAKESSEISEGKFFKIESATVTYEDGTVFAFKDYGKTAYLLSDGEIAIETPEKIIVCSVEEKVYSEMPMENTVNSISSALCFSEETYKYYASILAAYPDFKSTTETVAGKTCTVVTYTTYDDDGNASTARIGGWNRITMLAGDVGSNNEIRAKSVKESAESSLFAVPSGYSKVEAE